MSEFKIGREVMKDSLPFKLGYVTKLVFKKLNSQLTTEGIPVKAEQLPILMVLYFGDHSLTQQDIANVLQKDKSGILRSVQTLQKDGFLKIENDIEDKRKNLVSLTPAGKFVCERVGSLAMSFNNHIMTQLSVEEQASCLSLLDRIAAIIEN